MAFARAVPFSGSCGAWRTVATTANGLPAVACYLDASRGGVFEGWSITALDVRAGRIAEITSFLGAEHFALFGLPADHVNPARFPSRTKLW
jgi:RNA polymerase sigma-70 factor (ECF subfamily)